MSVMLGPSVDGPPAPAGVRRDFRRWVHLTVAALAMTATMPGRTQGLGLITEPLMADLHLGRVPYGSMNTWATLLGALFCLPCGWLIDRLGVRAVLTATVLGLGAVVLAMSRFHGDGVTVELAVAVVLTRGLGQSALSVVSLTLMGQAAGRRPGLAVAVYSVLVAVGFMGAFGAAKAVLEYPGMDWRTLWAGVGAAVLAFGAVAWLFLPRFQADYSEQSASVAAVDGLTLGQSLRTSAFWVFAVATSFYGLITAGIGLFNQSILEERGFQKEIFYTILTISPFIGLVSNLTTGWLASRWPLGRLLAGAMFLFTAALVAFPFVVTLTEVYLYAAALATAGGMITVLFFAVWAQDFGQAHLGKIQGAAQMLTVLASAVGPLALASWHEGAGSYVPFFLAAAVISAALAAAAWWTPKPRTSGAPAV